MNNTKLILNFVIDNSASMKGDKILKLKNALQKFDNELISLSLSDKIEYSITLFKGFNSTIYKTYENKLNLDQFYAGGIPFVNDALINGISNLLKRIETLNKASIETYKPWTILLLNGENYDNLVALQSQLQDLSVMSATNEVTGNYGEIESMEEYLAMEKELA